MMNIIFRFKDDVLFVEKLTVGLVGTKGPVRSLTGSRWANPCLIPPALIEAEKQAVGTVWSNSSKRVTKRVWRVNERKRYGDAINSRERWDFILSTEIVTSVDNNRAYTVLCLFSTEDS